jgi:hypothetical protein
MIESLKDLKSLLKLCRHNGVTEIKIGNVELKLLEMPKVNNSVEEAEEDFSDFPDGPLTPEELTFFANGGKPEENPYRPQ